MKNVSNEFKRIIKAGGPFYAYAKVVLAGGEQLTMDSENDFSIDGNGYSESGGSGFPLGVAMSKQITILLDNSDDRYSDYDFYGAEITLYTEVDIPGGTVERIPEGIFTVVDSVAPGDVLEITACDNMYKLDAEYTSKLAYPATLQQIWNELCSTYDLSSGSPAFENNDFQVQTKPEGLTGRQMAGYIAQLAIGNAIVDKNGRLIIKSYDFTGFDDLESINQGEIETSAGYPVLSEFTQNPDIGTDDVTITGVTATVEAEGEEEEKTIIYGTDSYALAIDNPLIAGREETAIALIGDRLIGMTIRPFSGEFFPNPTIEFADLAYLVDRKDKVYKTIITDHSFDYLGSSNLSNGLESPERNRSSYPNNTTEIYRKTQAAINKSKTEWQKAVDNLGKELESASGLYPTVQQQPDGSSIYYFHDKKTLKESKVVFKITSQAMGISTDGGKTYPVGLTVDGEAIIKILQTIGINADWINTGAITVKDEDDNIIFSVDMNTNQVIISGDSVRIGGESVADMVTEANQNASEALKKAQEAQSLSISLTNEYQGIPTDSNGNYTVFPECKTTAMVLFGSVDISDSARWATEKSAGVEGTWSAATRTYTVTGLSTDSGWVDITATYLTLSVTKRISISKQKQGQQGLPGLQGEDGKDGIPGTDGKDGVDGKTSYFHIKYSSVSNPTSSSQMTETPSTYIGTYVDFTQADSTDPKKYTWARFEGLQGKDGTDGIPGKNGENGQTSYLHIKYSNDGGNTFTSNNGETPGDYIGQYTDFEKSDSTRVSDYTWSKTKGDDGRTYFIEPSVTIIKRSKDNSIDPSYIEFRAYYRDGTSATKTPYAGRFKIEETVDGNSWTTVYTSASNETYTRHELYSALATMNEEVLTTASGRALAFPRDLTQIRCTVYESGGTTNPLDIQSVAIVTDVDNLTHEEIFDLLTNNGEVKGIYKEGNQLYISFTYAKGGTLKLGGANNGNGVLNILDNSGKIIGNWDKDGIQLTSGNIEGVKITSSNGKYSIKIDNGNITFSYNEKILAVVNCTNADTFFIDSVENLNIRCKEFRVTKYSEGSGYSDGTGWTGLIQGINTNNGVKTLNFINGILCGVI